MNYNMLTVKEILRIAQPETPLEVKLFDILEADALESDELRDRVIELQDDMEDMYSNDEGREMLNDVEDRDSEIDALKKLLDDNDIDYSDIV